jgi:uncharacterized protein YmfQ (DUF2313 family)
MIGYLPGYYSLYKEMRYMIQAEGLEIDDLQQKLNETFDQHFVDTATWGLGRWETELGIKTKAGQPDDERRSVIKSRLRGVGTVTVTLMKSVAEAYDRGSIEVTEQPASYQFTIKFIDTLGAPPNIDDLKDAIEDIKPAHLNVIYEYKYLLINQVHQVMTIDEIQTRPLTDFAPFVPV